jgi:hypothetical protein
VCIGKRLKGKSKKFRNDDAWEIKQVYRGSEKKDHKHHDRDEINRGNQETETHGTNPVFLR